MEVTLSGGMNANAQYPSLPTVDVEATFGGIGREVAIPLFTIPRPPQESPQLSQELPQEIPRETSQETPQPPHEATPRQVGGATPYSLTTLTLAPIFRRAESNLHNTPNPSTPQSRIQESRKRSAPPPEEVTPKRPRTECREYLFLIIIHFDYTL